MGVVVALAEPELPSALRQEFAERICAAWHKSREKIIALGRALIEAKGVLQHGEFTAMIESDLPFGAEHARRFMRIASDPRLSNRASTAVLPATIDAMDKLRRLNDEQFEAAIGTGAIHPDMTVRDADDLVSQFYAAPPYAIERTPHRPEASKCGPPVAPRGLHASSWSELAYLLIERRKALGLSQGALDDKIGWGDGQTSKYEIPHQDDGRIPRADHLLEWAQGLGVRFEMVVA